MSDHKLPNLQARFAVALRGAFCLANYFAAVCCDESRLLPHKLSSCAQQIHSVLADSEYLAKFHKESHGSSSVEVEPWDPPGSGSGFVWKRRCLFTAPLQGPPWFKTMLGERSSSKLLWRKNTVQMPSTFRVFQDLQFRPLKGLSGHHSFNSG